MKKGFTLVELLIVMVIVGVLTFVALPKYQTAVERTRALEAMENICMIQQYYKAHKQIDYNFTFDVNEMPDKIIPRYFTLSGDGDSITATRNSSDWSYSISTNDGISSCSGSDCARLDIPQMHCDVEGD